MRTVRLEPGRATRLAFIFHSCSPRERRGLGRGMSASAAFASSSSGPDFAEKTYAIPALCGDKMPVRCRAER